MFVLLACSVLAFSSCEQEEEVSGSSVDGYFFSENVSFNLLANKEVSIPVVRLGKEGDLTVNVTTEGPSIFKVPSSVTIKDGERVGNLVVSYNLSDVSYNTDYVINVKISDFKSLFGFDKLTATIQYPTSYYQYGEGHIEEGWWGEAEDKIIYARDFGNNILQCYLPDCWGHDSGAGYPVQNYVFFWDTVSNKVYVPFQYMGCEDWCIADRGAVACKFGGPDYKEGSADWMKFIDDYYAQKGFTHPYFDPAKNAFYLSDTAACSPADGSVAYGDPGVFDVLFVK